MPKKATAKKTVKKATSKKAEMTKADFVRSLPAATPAKDVVAKAKEAKISLTEDYVYKTRSLDKKGKGKKAGKAGTAAPPKARGKAPDKKQRVLALKAENPDWTADQIAKAAKCSTTYVYSVWGGSKKAGGSANGTATTPKSPIMQHLDHVRALRGVILHVGIDQAKAMMDQIVKDLMVLPT